ncbi:hypothetical protein BP6252_09401 [Coleophoma cylindrospora]|uniref:Uncharacterized protein n=1 Tax=Coleophoma cylindrospora TaxID=1849047 RepID=A0A3D8R1T3_9HELO|nr:hypothetical protein BP6252_09401 [Coleophoma cylindrospora]
MDDTPRIVETDAMYWPPWEAKPVSEKPLWSGTFQPHPHFVLPPKKSSALVIKRRMSDGQMQEVVVPKPAQIQKAPLGVDVGQSQSPTYSDIMVETPEVKRASPKQIAPTQPQQSNEDAEQIKRKFMDIVWGKRNANPSVLEPPGDGETKVIATTATLQDLATHSLNNTMPARSLAVREPSYFKAPSRNVNDLKEMESLAKLRSLPDESPECYAVIPPALFGSNPSSVMKKHTQVAPKKVERNIASGPKQINTKNEVSIDKLVNRWTKKTADLPTRGDTARSKAAALEPSKAEPRRPAVATRRVLPSKKPLVDDSFTTRAQVVNVDGVYYDIETLKSTGLQDHALAKEFLENQSKKSAPAKNRNEKSRHSPPASFNKPLLQSAAKPRRKAAPSPKIRSANQKTEQPKPQRTAIGNPSVTQEKDAKSAHPITQCTTAEQTTIPPPLVVTEPTIQAKAAGSLELERHDNAIVTDSDLGEESKKLGDEDPILFLTETQSPPKADEQGNGAVSQEQEEGKRPSSFKAEDDSDSDDEDGGVQLL